MSQMISEGHATAPWLSGRFRSFQFAFRGLRRLYRESNAKIHAAATAAVVIAGVATRLTPMEWGLVLFAVGLVWTAEALNTALELLCDATMPARHPLVGEAKDVGACAVLVAAVAAVAIGGFVFLPRLVHG